MQTRFSGLGTLLALVCLLTGGARAQNLGNAWHISDNSSNLGGTHMRSPRFEIGTNTTVTIYNGNQFQGGGTPGNQTGGTLFYKAAGAGSWSSTPLGFDRTTGNNKFWSASFSTSAFAPSEPVEYYLRITYSDRDTTYLYGKDSGSSRTPTESVAQASPFSLRTRPAFVCHANNRVVNGSTAQFWVKTGYIGKDGSLASRWADNGAVYYTTEGSSPTGALGVASNFFTRVVPLHFDHVENDSSVAGNASWWEGAATDLPAFTTIRYRIGLWHSANNEKKFADYNTSGTNGATFSFSLGTTGAPELTVNGVNADYTTAHLFVDEVAGDSVWLPISFKPNVANVTVAEVFSNLNNRDRAGLDANGDGIEVHSFAGRQPHHHERREPLLLRLPDDLVRGRNRLRDLALRAEVRRLPSDGALQGRG